MLMNYYLGFLFNLLLTDIAFAKICYTTDLHALRNGNLNGLKASLQDCSSSLAHTLEQHGVKNSKMPEYLEYSCYTLAVDIDEPIGDLNIYGCTPKGGCEVIKNAFMSTIRHHGGSAANKIHGATCVECEGNKCNVDTKRKRRSTIRKVYYSDVFKTTVDASWTAIGLLG